MKPYLREHETGLFLSGFLFELSLHESTNSRLHRPRGADVYLHPGRLECLRGLAPDVPRENHIHPVSGYEIPGSRSPGHSMGTGRVCNGQELISFHVHENIERTAAEARVHEIRQFRPR